jgi:hypothetical protein
MEMKSRTILGLICVCISLTGSCQLNEGINHSTINILTGNEKFEVNALIWLPPNYSSSKRYPLVIYGHGSGQAGKELSQLYLDGLPMVLKAGFRPPFDCIIICPQRASYGILPDWLPGIIEDAEKRFAIDTTRIYLTGTSAGGYMCYGSQLNISMSLSKKIAAICVISGATQDIKKENIEWWIRSKTPCWAIVGSEDQAYVRQNIFLINSVNQRSPGLAKITIRHGIGHGNWDEIYDGSFTDNGVNLWQWLYKFKLEPPAKPPEQKKSGKRVTIVPVGNQIYCLDVARRYNILPGDTIVIPTGIKSFLLRNFKGERNKPVYIIPEDSGWLGGYANYSANISFATYFKLSGFHIDGNNITHFGLVVGDQTGEYELSNCKIRNIGSIGLCAKQDPDTTQVKGYWPGYTIKNVSIHDISVKNTGTEGFYLGYTFSLIKPLASPILNLNVYNVFIDSTGWDGLQLSNCQNVYLHNVSVSHYGLLNQSGQQAGLLIGGMVTLQEIRNVNISDGTGTGLLIFGRGKMKFEGINFKNVGMTKGENAIYVNDYPDYGFGLPPLSLDLNNIKIDGTSGYALMVTNYNKSMLPGTIQNFSYKNTMGGIVDKLDQIKSE